MIKSNEESDDDFDEYELIWSEKFVNYFLNTFFQQSESNEPNERCEIIVFY